MQLDETLKHLLQVCADIQDGFWMAAGSAEKEELPALFQDAAVQWNSFADQIFLILLRVNHTSPDAKWKANPNRRWLNHFEDLAALGDQRLCHECVLGLADAQSALIRASATAGHPDVRALVDEQLKASANQIASLRPYVGNGLERSAAGERAHGSDGDPPVH